jgi:hypothetical protein
VERVEDHFWRTRCPGLTEIVIGWSMLSEKFPEKASSQPEKQNLLEASFLREMGGHTLSKIHIGILGGA